MCVSTLKCRGRTEKEINLKKTTKLGGMAAVPWDKKVMGIFVSVKIAFPILRE